MKLEDSPDLPESPQPAPSSPPDVPMTRINQPSGGFFIPSTVLFMKDFLDTACRTSSSPLNSIPISQILYNILTAYLLRQTVHNNPHNDFNHHTIPCRRHYPLWRQTRYCGAQKENWAVTKKFLHDFRPCIDVAGDLFYFCEPEEYKKAQEQHEISVKRKHKAGENIGVRRPIWDDGYRTPFAGMRITVTGNNGVAPMLVRDMMQGWDGNFDVLWSVVIFLGGWMGGAALFAPTNGEIIEKVEVEAGNAWVLRGGIGSGKGCVFGLSQGPIIGERIMVELYVPVSGWTGL
ncbi:hypothetical protein WAI453_010196 [Rhynchosporium graminicola]|uniref:Uncharacterized protein n=1 Tax=Rhynchosporium graminicola TaxID=2792576 RepID=A0A1E1KJ75_9HELO|nr:uncharacterized protein RCO7_02635 [Rhynchosporium commune]